MRNIKVVAALSAAVFAVIPGAFAQVYLSNSFGAGSSVTTTGNSSTPVGVIDASGNQWYQSAAGITALNGEAMRITNGNTMVMTHFNETPVSIATPGTSITVSFDFSTTGTPAHSTFKIGLFDSFANLTGSDHSRPTVNSSGVVSSGSSGATATTASQPYLNWSGYYLNLNPVGSSGNASSLSFARRVDPNTGSTSLMTNSNTLVAMGSAVSADALAANTLYNLSFTITYLNLSELRFDAVIVDTTSDTVVNSATYLLEGSIPLSGGTAFDTLALNPNASAGTPGWTFDNISISVNSSAIPEPSTYAALFGALALGLVALRRRQLAKSAA